MDEITLPYYWSNHDAAYNVLFSDGSVKTFSDAGRSIYKYFVTEKLAGTPGMKATVQDTHRAVWEQYFDPLYAQD